MTAGSDLSFFLVFNLQLGQGITKLSRPQPLLNKGVSAASGTHTEFVDKYNQGLSSDRYHMIYLVENLLESPYTRDHERSFYHIPKGIHFMVGQLDS